MNKTHASPINKLFSMLICLLLLFALAAIACVHPAQADATNITKTEMNEISAGKKTISFKAGNAKPGKKVTTETKGSETSYCLAYSTSGDKTYYNPLTYTASKVGTIDGQDVNMTLKITEVAISKTADSKVDTKGLLRFACIDNSAMTIGTYGYDSDTAEKWGLDGNGTGVRMTVKYTITFTAGNGYILKVADIDQSGEGEKWKGNSGFKEIFSRGGEKASLDGFKATASSSGKYFQDFYCSSSGSSFSGTYKGGNCSMTIRMYVPNFPGNPSKTASTSETKVGESFDWVITRNMPTFYKDTIATYSKCTIYDRLDSRLKYVKARVYLGTTEVTGSGTLSVNGQDVTWSAGSGFLGNKSNYNGAELKMVLTTQVTGIGSISNEATVNYCNARTTPVYTTPVPATINYYRDYQAGDTTPCYVDKTTNTSSGYQINSKADSAAKRADCSGLDGWYTDPECTKRYDGSWVPSNTDYVLNLYSKNRVTLSYAATSDSWFNKHPSRSVFADKDLSDKLTDRTAGKTASGASIFPASKEAYYGDVITVDSGESLWFESEIFGSGDKATRELKCSDGVYAYQDGSGDLLKEVRLTSNSTAYLKWLAGSYDGVYAAG